MKMAWLEGGGDIYLVCVQLSVTTARVGTWGVCVWGGGSQAHEAIMESSVR